MRCQTCGVSGVVSDVGWGGGAEDRRRRAGDRGGRTTRAPVCRPPFRKRRAPLLIMPVRLRFACRGQRRLLPNNTEVPLACKRNRQVGVSGDPFRITPRVKLSNTLRV
ncbi:MAG: hypothetical protein LBK25_06960 [Treponema sp.]|nr:hypothetical protein [Treponema sp.]